MESALLQERLRNEDAKAFEEVYTNYRESFLNYALKFNLDKDTLLDIYQDATIAMFQNFVTKQISLESGTVKTYLFAIGKYKIYDAMRQQQKVILKEVPDEEPVEAFDFEIEEAPSERQTQLASSFRHLSKGCKEVLKMYYYRNLTIKEIVELTHYKDENTVKSHKSRCLKGLKKSINSPD